MIISSFDFCLRQGLLSPRLPETHYATQTSFELAGLLRAPSLSAGIQARATMPGSLFGDDNTIVKGSLSTQGKR